MDEKPIKEVLECIQRAIDRLDIDEGGDEVEYAKAYLHDAVSIFKEEHFLVDI